jgi:hypothetical protein
MFDSIYWRKFQVSVVVFVFFFHLTVCRRYENIILKLVTDFVVSLYWIDSKIKFSLQN